CARVIHERSAVQARDASGRALPSRRRESVGVATSDFAEHGEGTVDLAGYLALVERSQSIVPVDVVVAVDAELVSLGNHTPKEIGERACDLGTGEQCPVERRAKTVQAEGAAPKHFPREALLGEEAPDGPTRVVGAHRHVHARSDAATAENVEEPREARAKAAVGADVELER